MDDISGGEADYLAHATASTSAWADLYNSSLLAKSNRLCIIAGSSSSSLANCLPCQPTSFLHNMTLNTNQSINLIVPDTHLFCTQLCEKMVK
ncbi:hypothetical protein Hanom_Chr04g00279791 [Helianthus anomalus]